MGDLCPQVDTKPASDILAGAVARAASQGTIHPLDTLKVRMQAEGGLSKYAKLVPPPGMIKRGVPLPPACADQMLLNAPGATAGKAVKRMLPRVASLYKGVVGAASGAGIYIGTYFAFYGAACNVLSRRTDLSPGGIAFVAGGIAAAGGSVVKVPLAVCIRSVQAGVYPNVFAASRAIIDAAGVRGLFTGYLPTLLEDVPDMAFKFAAYESLRSLHRRANGGRTANAQEDFAMGAAAGAFAAAATTPLDVIKTNMMCTAASRPTMASSARTILAQGGPSHFFRGVGPRALSNGINSAVFFCFFEALRSTFKQRKALVRTTSAMCEGQLSAVSLRASFFEQEGSVCMLMQRARLQCLIGLACQLQCRPKGAG
ncbi:mitochondrial carrier [Coccomyxa subellipsoidea C-169]|uniref:Mitochondrial carrier n=1 Tax=Coccomyxa subellipsoidea (strain C-169) TaxID=574566 RepID=I0Z2R3_COCSC|nr:mitochondrial carrier [Coccomyxa subellipsoidea C-169]EIE24932.1 mitochondrial carrier [Coccomyxa subellipsoidea C-169]|eukprot:XP_005649476.1 mitochondrial carrier [Coccomyxa subellipsoidea C-169]